MSVNNWPRWAIKLFKFSLNFVSMRKVICITLFVSSFLNSNAINLLCQSGLLVDTAEIKNHSFLNEDQKKNEELFTDTVLEDLDKLKVDLIYDEFSEKDSVLIMNGNAKKETRVIKNIEKLISLRLQKLNINSPMDLSYNEKVKIFIDRYLEKDKKLVERMKGLAPYYFPLFEQQLDRYNLPLELKYLAIVESGLNPKARSYSGATGLWQFMYPTGKQYELSVTSYVDDRQDPLKSTIAACEYFVKLYETFGDWNLVLAAYNGGPGYIQRKIADVGTSNFWELYPYLKEETRNYIPTFIAVNYVMNYADDYLISAQDPYIALSATDTLRLKDQVNLKVLSELLCVNSETLDYLNPSYKKSIYPKEAVIILPLFAADDFKLNEESSYNFIQAVEKKEILINEERLIYSVNKGDYLGRIAKEYNVRVFEIVEWNSLTSSHLDVGDQLVLYVKKREEITSLEVDPNQNEYIIQKGDTLWGIAQKHKGLSVWKIKALNNLDSDNLMPGTKIILPIS